MVHEEIIGFDELNFLPREGERVDGWQVYVVTNPTSPTFEGLLSYKHFLSKEKFPDFQPVLRGKYNAVYNRSGKLVSFTIKG